jgi:hypothetical protein
MSMNNYNPTNINQALINKEFPTVTMWNRLEARPRTFNFDKALKAEVRDALWMLTKQWQMGEFKGDDAGTPVFAKVCISSSHLDTYKATGQAEQAYEKYVPLETKAEQKKIPFTRDHKEISLDIRLQLGKYWLKLLKKEGIAFDALYIGKYKFEIPEHNRSAAHIYAHREVWQQYKAVSRRCMDGYKLYEHVATGGNASLDISNTDPDMSKLNNLGIVFKNWFEKNYYQPLDEQNNAWVPEKLEYQFECKSGSTEETKTLRAEEYYQGHLDWYAFDIAQNKTANQIAKDIYKETFIPTHVAFDGMPNTRWWKFEDGKTNLGDIKPATTDLAKLLLMEFGLVYANDWFVIPYTLPIGSLANVEGLVVRNNFGETIWIESTEKAEIKDLPWSMFKMHAEQQNNTLFLAPASMKVQEGNALEEIQLIRDEMANMVWGVESLVASPLGEGIKGNEVALRTRQFHEFLVSLVNKTELEALFYLGKLNELSVLSPALDAIKTKIIQIIADLALDTPNIYKVLEDLTLTKEGLLAEGIVLDYVENKPTNEYKAKVSYQAMTSVPENWIPFVPVHIKETDPSNRETQLQRASMLRIIEGDPVEPPVKVKPLTSMLRQGLEDQPQASAYYIHEEEVPRAGVRVLQAFQRTRWTNGEVFVWLGMKKKTGKGEGSSGLAFDQLKDSQ